MKLKEKRRKSNMSAEIIVQNHDVVKSSLTNIITATNEIQSKKIEYEMSNQNDLQAFTDFQNQL